MPSMIVAPQPLAVEAGARVLLAGGNAIDAAVTCAFVQGVVSPQMCGLGGYSLLTVHLAPDAARGAATTHVVDAPALAGARATPTMWADRYIGPNPDGWGYFLEGKVNDSGYGAICTPGSVRGLADMLARWGTISWAAAIAPAAELADRGFMVDTTLAAGWKRRRPHPQASSLLDHIQSNAEARGIYLRADGTPYDEGDHLRNPDHARTLRQLAAAGADDFYHGDLAQRMVADLAAQGGFVTAADLADYPLLAGPPLTGTYRGYTVATVGAPHGGPTLLAMLNILEGTDLASLGHNSPEYIYRVAMAMKAAFADRNPYLGDPRFGDVPVAWMVDKARAAEWRAHIDSGAPISVAFTPSEHPDTTHVSVVDTAGNCVALTHSLGSSSGVITPGLGFIYNNSMTNFHPLPGHPNSIAPGKGRTTGMSPTIVYKDGRPVLVLGAPGSSRIITSVLQVLLNVLDFGLPIADAVLAPRFDCQGDLILCQARIPEFVCDAVRPRHPIARLPQSHGGLALVHAIAVDPATGALTGGADAGSGGMALAV
ncbi:MAG TPA: gamma-glutamyltransferase [Chloroflexia bacterium]|nr:gamma-glutamyltransferase [Chloroflexia bacterium]